MASPYDESEPTEEIIDAGFDPLIFWDQNKQLILIVSAVVLLAAIGFGGYEFITARRAAAAESALATAASQEDYQKIVDQYPGTVAGGNASLFLADKLRGEKKYDDAAQVLNTFLAKYPTHPLLHAGMLSLGETLEAQGKTQEALSEYQDLIGKYQDSYSAPLAALASGNLLKAQGKLEDARRIYENFLSQFPDSVFTNEAMAEMHLMRAPAGAATAAASASPATLSLPATQPPAGGLPGLPAPVRALPSP